LAALGQTQESLALLTQAVAQLRAIESVSGLPGPLTWLAKIASMLGQPAEV
jgi:hypothetical protein